MVRVNMSGRIGKSIVMAANSVRLVEPLEDRRLLSAALPLWFVNGTAADDTIVIQLNAKDAAKADALVNGRVVGTRAIDRIRGIQVNSFNGNDNVSVDLGAGSKTPVTLTGGNGNDTLVGGAGSDRLLGGPGSDSLSGGMGNDTLVGGGGNDILSGDEGGDRLDGEMGNDTLAGGLGADIAAGEAGNDRIAGGFGDDKIYGGGGNDQIVGGDGSDYLSGGTGANTVFHESKDYWRVAKFDTSQQDQRTNPLHKVQDADALKQWIIDNAVQQYSSLFGQTAYPYWYYPYLRGGVMYDLAGGPMTNAAGGAGDTSAPAPEHSATNNQEAGVDEADMVKTDGNYIYLVQNNELLIFSAWPADQSKIVSRTTLDGWSDSLFLEGDRLIVIGSTWTQDEPPELPPVDTGGDSSNTGAGDAGTGDTETGDTGTGDTGTGDAGAGDTGDTTTGDTGATASAAMSNLIAIDPVPGRMMPIWRWWWGGKQQTTVTIYDISDRTAPKVISKTTYDGSLSTSRDINGSMYLVLDNNIDVPRPKILAGDKPDAYVYESKDDYVARLQAMTLEDLLPQVTTTTIDASGQKTDTTAPIVTAADLYLPDTNRSFGSMFSVVLMDLNAPVPAMKASTSVVGFSGTVYVSQNSLYVATQSWDTPMGDWAGDCQTDLYKFALTSDSIAFEGTGEVPGWTVNEFAMSEENGYFRIATTTESDGQSNNIFVLQDQGDTLNVVGGLTGLALSERIYAARFVGDVGYLVTFRQTDPLFTIDLSDPTNPQLKGVLEIPGYSSYLHPIGDNLMIGFGRDADAAGHVQGLKVTLFDVSNIADPKVVDTFTFDTGKDPSGWWNWNYSQAEWDHHAFSYFPDEHVLAVPVLDNGWWDGSAKLEVIKIDATAGLTEMGQIEHTGQVLRSLEIGDCLYSIGTDDVKVVSIADPSQQIADVPLQDPEATDPTDPGTPDPVPPVDGGTPTDSGTAST